MRNNLFAIVLFFLIQNFYPTLSSAGDLSPFYQNCVRSCRTANCTKDDTSFKSESSALQDEWSRLLRWDCLDECRYHCMWRTVQAFQERNYRIPKFHGKWPFKRVLGVQEPAAALSSLLNLAATVYMYCRLAGDERFSLRDTPMLKFWHMFIAVCLHAWTWSTIFHTRDTPFTELMDYACALSMVLSLFVAAVVRMLHRRRILSSLILMLTLVYFVEHVRYLRAGRVDYEYNMTVNVCCGLAGSVLWVAWALAQLRAGRRYAWRVLLFTLLSGAALLLELGDFPPVMRAWDAHALWHLSTAPLPFLFYRFVIDDLDHLQTSKKIQLKIEKSDLKTA